jgi:aspartyl-tRNA(Asn)/glutamyl-tRNA(Gln) amidotransferase subunit A
MTITQAAADLRARKVSAAELTAASLERIEKGQKLNAFITVAAEAAAGRARERDAELARGVDRGPLHGIPVAVKDVFSTKGVRTTCGSKVFAEYVPARDAAVVERLEAAGAIIVGKTNMHELAYGITSNNPHFGPVRNPWNPEHVPGGSSGGSGSAVAANMVFMAMGSDTGGSIRIPASFCGTVGLKPTFGRVSRFGVLPLDFSLDHMGPLTRSVRDAAVTLNFLAGHDPRDDSSSRQKVADYLPARPASIAGVKIGLPENFYFDKLDPEVEDAVKRMAKNAEALGAQITLVRVPDIEAVNAVGRVILLAEAASAMERHLKNRTDFGADVLALLDQGRLLPATDYIQAQRLRRRMRQECGQLWKHIDCLFTPTTPATAPRIGQTQVKLGEVDEDVRLAATRLVRAINVFGFPALSIPCGVSRAGLPMGLQIIGAPFQEALILRVGAALEDARGGPQRLPDNL